MEIDGLPRHIAIIMDGNGRWAESRGLPRFRGHLAGVKSIERIVKEASRLGIEVLTLFAFSEENWSRPPQEVSMLINTICSALDKKVSLLDRTNVKIHSIGRRSNLSPKVIKSINNAIKLTEKNTGLVLNVAFNYGARQEIIDAVKKIADAVKKNEQNIADIDEHCVSRALYTSELPDPDLLIRTSGEKRISNFLLWQLSYAELYFTNIFWPDFDEKELKKAILDFKKRERRYGNVAAVKS